MKKSTFVYACAAVFFAFALPLWGQSGCVDSPEDPTVMLALVGASGALVSLAWARVRRHNSPRR